jgi:hypothetical protein
MSRPHASLSLDLDNLWAYQKIHGDAGWESFPTYIPTLAPIVTERLRRHGLTITVFLVGQDAALPKNHAALRSIADQGHEIGNHSFSHEPWFHEYRYEDVVREIGAAEDAIAAATGKRPHGFRGPGFSLSRDTLRVLGERKYIYDASTFPTFLGPIARAYYFWKARDMPAEEKAKRKKLYGTMSEGLRPLKPYTWQGDGLVEIPVTTMPIARVPMHMSYILYLALRSVGAAMAYLRSALLLCRARGIEPSFLLHPLDFLGGDKVTELGFFPGMNASTEFKLELFDRIIDAIRSHFEPVTMEQHARALLASGELPSRVLS